MVHGGEIGVFHHDELAVAGVLLEIFFDGLFGFPHVDGQKDQAFAGELMADLVDEGGFVSAEAAPGGPEFEEHDLAFDGVVGEFFTGRGGGVEAWGRFFVLGASECAESGENQCTGKRDSQREGSRHGRSDVNKWPPACQLLCWYVLQITLLSRNLLNTEFTENAPTGSGQVPGTEADQESRIVPRRRPAKTRRGGPKPTPATIIERQ